MRLKGGADDKIYYYDFESSAWADGNTEGKYNVSIKYNDDTDDIAIEVGRRINKLIEENVIGIDKIERINIDVTNKNGEYKIGRNFKIYWSENNNMITVGCEYNGNCVVQQAKKIVREANAAIKEDSARNALVDAMKGVDEALEYASTIKKELGDFMKEEDAETYKLRPSTNQNININTNETSYDGLNRLYNQLTDQTYTNIEADIEADKNKSFNKENEVVKEIEEKFNDYFDMYQANKYGLLTLTFEKYIETFSINDKEKMLNYLEENPNYLNKLITNKEGVQWQTTEDEKHRLIAA